MTWSEALEIVVGRTGHERYRELCGESHPDHEAWRDRVIAKATGAAPAPARYPSLGRQALNLAGAVGRAAAAVAAGGPVRAPAELVERRRAICLPCEDNGERASGGLRCTKCGCGGAKLHLLTESCPAGKW